LTGVTIRDARLRGAVLEDVDLRQVQIRGADLEGLVIDGVRIDQLLARVREQSADDRVEPVLERAQRLAARGKSAIKGLLGGVKEGKDVLNEKQLRKARKKRDKREGKKR